MPPWEASPLVLEKELSQTLHKDLSNEEIKAIALTTISNNYPAHLKIYTDGSKYSDSTTAAMWVPSLKVEDKWKLTQGDSRSIMGAELFAIMKAMTWLLFGPLSQNQDVVILSDSKSGIMALENHHKRSYSFLVNQIVNLANILRDIVSSLTIQWVPSHVGLSGNEKADELAKMAHDLTDMTDAPLDIMEIKNKIRSTLLSRCQLNYDLAKQTTHIGSIKSKFIPWPWASMKNRRAETALARLRIGHSRLKAHLHRFGLVPSPDCDTCGTPEDTKHILEACSRSRSQRNLLHNTLRRLGCQSFSSKILLGGGDLAPLVQSSVLKAVGNYLSISGYLDCI